MGDPESISDLLEERQDTYQTAWRTTPLVMEYMMVIMYPIARTEWFFAWIMILNKLVRLMVSPGHKDSWRDIAGYATLVMEALDEAP